MNKFNQFNLKLIIKLTDDQRRCIHGEIVIKTAVYFSADHDKHLFTFLVSCPDGTTTASLSEP